MFLSVTGCEALFADLGETLFESLFDIADLLLKGHFGIWPVRLSWFCVVFPSVVTNYLGQGALLIVQPESIENPYLISNKI